MTHHILKAHPPMFWALKDGTKNFDVRKDDRAFQAGDTVEITYFDPNISNAFPPQQVASLLPPNAVPKSVQRRNNEATYRTPFFATITFVLRGGQYGVEDGYVVLALRELKD